MSDYLTDNTKPPKEKPKRLVIEIQNGEYQLEFDLQTHILTVSPLDYDLGDSYFDGNNLAGFIKAVFMAIENRKLNDELSRIFKCSE